jgi:hypothetical protein
MSHSEAEKLFEERKKVATLSQIKRQFSARRMDSLHR